MQGEDVIGWSLIFVRVSAYTLLFPIFSAQAVPLVVRLSFAAISAFLVVPYVEVPPEITSSLYLLIKTFFIEVCTGLTLGMLSRFIFYAVEMAGSIIATESGLMLSANFNPITNSFGSAPGALLHWLGIVLLLAFDLHHWVILGLQRSYEVVGPGAAQASEALLADITWRAGQMFLIALQMTAPILAASFIVTLVFALLGRAVPQMNVFSESFSVRTIAGLAIFGLTCNLLAQHLANHLQRIPEDFMRVTRILAG